ncbi:aminotransferase class V-fold PLP-dependent enzyme [Rubinisphaera italica]|uniref:Isopenicillin N epimerase n=1 Tax=Rubinisphaera italica TaxID=2527969 RepID=A0A5C5XGM3_9PLAN|nr:aminotransferase class V-fold PLP-dependent enzyme [Rubinisphaera italica]TWT61964.1 Isopenicillin N epimerase [Rubinisphaera italica]
MKSSWSLDPEITYLNHGSFGPSPNCVQQAQREWMSQLESNPMEFLVRQRERLLDEMLAKLGQFIGSPANCLIPVENATFGMNIVANSVPLQAGDEVLLTNHEYGAVERIWQKKAASVGAKIVIATLPIPFQDADEIVEAVFRSVTPQTRLLVISHVTSPTALVLPVEKICQRAREQKLTVCIDGSHAIAMRPLNLKTLNCDFYTASCHKWLCAPFGTGFLYVAPQWQQNISTVNTSWGGTMYGREKSWQNEFLWVGTSDPSRFLAISNAIDFLEDYGLERFREETYHMASQTYDLFSKQFRTEPYSTRQQDWFGSMVTIPLPESVPVPAKWTGRPHPLQERLAQKHRIEVPIVKWSSRMHIRISSHLYNDFSELERLSHALKAEIL